MMKIKNLKSTDFPHRVYVGEREKKVPEATNTNFNILIDKVNELVDAVNAIIPTVKPEKIKKAEQKTECENSVTGAHIYSFISGPKADAMRKKNPRLTHALWQCMYCDKVIQST